MTGRMIVCSFSGSLSELPKRKRTLLNALHVLANDPRVSCFDRGSAWLESLIDEMKVCGLVIEDHAEPYPWCRFDLTNLGRALLANSKTPNAKLSGPQRDNHGSTDGQDDR